MFAALVILAGLLSSCTRSVGPTVLGTIGPGGDELAVMRLRPGVEASSCRRWILGIPLDGDAARDPLASMITELLSRDPEATVVSEADIRWDHLTLGVFERQCVTVRGVLGRTMRTITIPGGADAHGYHGHHE